MNKQDRNRLRYREQLTVARWEGLGTLHEKGEGIKQYKLVATK